MKASATREDGQEPARVRISHSEQVSGEEIKLSIDAVESFKLFRLERQFEGPNRLKVPWDLCSAGPISPSGIVFRFFLLVGHICFPL